MDSAPYASHESPKPYSPQEPFYKQFTIIQWISLFSWLLLVVTSLVSLVEPSLSEDKQYDNYLFVLLAGYSKVFWLSLSPKEAASTSYAPIIVQQGYFYFCFIILIGLIFVSCCIIFYNIFYNIEVINGLFQNYSKYHFIPLLSVSALFMIGELMLYSKSPNHPIFIFNFIFTLIALCSLIFIHMKTDLSNSKAINLIIKQGTYGCLIALLVYNLFFSIYFYGENLIEYKEVDRNDAFAKNCYITFIILIGIINLGLSVFLKNIIIPIINLFLYIGMIIWFFKIPAEKRDDKGHGPAEGIIGIVVIVADLVILIYLFIKKRDSILQ